MNEFTATEIAYKNGYNQALKEFAEMLKAKHRIMTDYDEAGFGYKTFVVYEETIDQVAKELERR